MPACSHICCCSGPCLANLISWLDANMVITVGRPWVLVSLRQDIAMAGEGLARLPSLAEQLALAGP